MGCDRVRIQVNRDRDIKTCARSAQTKPTHTGEQIYHFRS
jgi:hypothetical protein